MEISGCFSVIVIGACRSAGNSEKLCQLLDLICTRKENLLVAEDFNYPEMDRQSMYDHAENCHSVHQYVDSIRRNYLHQHVMELTRRVQGQSSGSGCPHHHRRVYDKSPSCTNLQWGHSDHCCLVSIQT